MRDGSSRPPRKQTSGKRTTSRQQEQQPGPEAQPPPAAVDMSLNQWLVDVVNAPKRIEVFDRWWEFKQPTGGRAEQWDRLCGTDIEAALAVMLVDPEQVGPFLAAATEWVPPAAAEEFWSRFSKALFGLGEP